LDQSTVPFYRPELGEPEIQEVLQVLRSGWLTTGPRVQRFEQEFASAVSARYAVALNSCTAALHLAVYALGLQPGQGVLIPAMTFAATAEVIRYLGAVPILVDCDPVTLNMDLAHAEQMIERIHSGAKVADLPAGIRVVGIIPVHVGGLMMDVDRVKALASRHGLWVVEDAAHAFPAAWRPSAASPWQRCGQNTSNVACFSFYANKTITTGEGGMAVTDDPEIANQLRLLSLHGLSKDAWDRYSGRGSWDYRIIVPGYKYNLTDIAAAIGVHQLARADEMRAAREAIALEYCERLHGLAHIELPPVPQDRIHAWHLFPIRLRLDQLTVDRNMVFSALREEGVSCSVHWRPLHLHPYYEQTYKWQPQDLPVASAEFARLISLPLFSAMRRDEIDTVVASVKAVCERSSRRRLVAVQ